ncbi:hypothetical protein [Virgisporangium aurantiacum]|uniref:Uncharacterized protein n=1 Tax=Virgisporangium aurantiacum TaxID=175570 RepID=A0A8J3ZJ92_9ACTN|nr:hypothetical protein [Virgisporangium aurantiacum]GIJ64904.1 hypothetical protein Vau01_124200 [Virgisporangium aurantiacum]
MITDHPYLAPSDIEPVRPEPYWRTQLHLPSRYADNRGMFADLWRRLLTRIFQARWRLTIEISIDADLDEPDRDSAVAAVESAMYAPGAAWTLLRADPGATPPWQPIAWARRPVAYLDNGAAPSVDDDGTTVWSCIGTVVVAFTVDVDEASWPSDRYLIGLATSPSPTLRTFTASGAWVIRRRPIHRHRRDPWHLDPVRPTSPGEPAAGPPA